MISKNMSIQKREKYGLISMAILNGLLVNLYTVNMGIKILRAINGFAIWSMIVIIAINFLHKAIDRTRMNMKISLLGIIWSLSFIALNVVEKRSLISIFSIMGVLALLLNIIGFKKGKDKLSVEEDPLRFGYILVGFMLLLPFFLMGVLLGY